VTPHRDGNAGSFILDRHLGKLGRLKMASGTTDADEFTALNSMITTLKKQRRWDYLALLTQRAVSPLELMQARDEGKLETLPSAEALLPLATTVERWLKTADLSERTKNDYRKRLEFPAGTKVLALPDLLRERRGQAIESGKRQTFDNQLTATQSLFRDVPGLAKMLVGLPAPFNPPHRPGNPQEPEQIRALALELPYPDELWAICLTGMRQGEYFPTRWDVLSDRVQIQGEKGRMGEPVVRVVPLVYRPARPRITYSTFYKALVRDSDSTLNVHDLRKTAQRWWEDAGVPDWRISLYAGHSKGRKDLARIYRKPRDLTRLLNEDAERIRAWLGDPPKAGLRAVNQ
jgi:hypothetical protein